MDRKKELKEQYKQMKPDMGVLIVKSNLTNKCHIEASQDLKSTINKIKFQLKMNSHYNKKLQKVWNEYGEASFAIEILEYLKYDKDETKADYSEELEILKFIWEEKLANKGMEAIK